MDYCNSLASHYQAACASQLGREILHEKNIANPFLGCINSSYSSEIQTHCVSIVSAIIAQREFGTTNTVKVPEYILSLPDELKSAYMKGIAGEYWAFAYSGIYKNWKPICNSFDKSFSTECESMFGHNSL